MIKFLIVRPIAVLMVTISVVILGVLAYRNIPISLMPDINIPVVTIQVAAANLSASELEGLVAKPIRARLLSLDGLYDLKSQSSDGQLNVTLKFNHDTRVDYAFMEVNERIDQLMSILPKDIDRPRVIKASASDLPVFYLNASLSRLPAVAAEGKVTQSFIDFNRFANSVIRKRLEQIPEVAMVDVSGIITPEIVIKPDMPKLLSLGMNFDDLENEIVAQNIQIGSITVNDKGRQYSLQIESAVKDINDIKEMHLERNGRILQFKELAEVEERPSERKGLVIFNGDEAVVMAVVKRNDARLDALESKLRSTLKAIQRDYPDIQLNIVRDQTKMLHYVMGNLGQDLLWGIMLAFLVMFSFLRDGISPILIAVSVPLSLLICLVLFYACGISINIISVSGLALATSLIIDNSIIVIDNISQFRSKGYSLVDACVSGVSTIFRPLLSSALTTCSVFVPLLFLSGIGGALFYDQAIAISIGLSASLLTCMTILPVMYCTFHNNEKRFYRFNNIIHRLPSLPYVKWYERGMLAIFRNQPVAISFVVMILPVTFFLFSILPVEQLPEISSNETIVKIDWNEPINVTENKRRVIALLSSVAPDIKEYNAWVGKQQFLLDPDANLSTSETILYLIVHDHNKLKLVKRNIGKILHAGHPSSILRFEEVGNVFNILFSQKDAPLTARVSLDADISVNKDEKLQYIWNVIHSELRTKNMEPFPWENRYLIVADRPKLLLHHISLQTLKDVLSVALNHKRLMSIVNGDTYRQVVLGGEAQDVYDAIDKSMIQNSDSTYFRVRDFVKIKSEKSIKTITAGKDGEYYPIDLNISANEMVETRDVIRSAVEKVGQTKLQFTGKIFDNNKLVRELMYVFSISLALLYLILATQFESLILPLIILFEIPIAMAGALLGLFVFDMSINLMSLIGLVVMSGVVINDSILKIDTINQLRSQGYSCLHAILSAGNRRIKPILMTSLTTILSLVPIMFTGGVGAELQAPLAVILTCGMLLGTPISLYFVPLLYHLINKLKLI